MIGRIKRWVELQKWLCIVAWRVATNRWYIFRDAPNSIVALFKNIDRYRDTDEARHVADMAREESNLRIKNIERKVWRLIDSIDQRD